jgi:hypothetical protein
MDKAKKEIVSEYNKGSSKPKSTGLHKRFGRLEKLKSQPAQTINHITFHTRSKSQKIIPKDPENYL